MLSVYAVDISNGETVAVNNWASLQYLEKYNDTAGGTLTTKSMAGYDPAEWLDVVSRDYGCVYVVDGGRAWSGFPFPTIVENSDGSAQVTLVGDFGRLTNTVVTPYVDPTNWSGITHKTYSGPVRTVLSSLISDYKGDSLLTVAPASGGPSVSISSRASVLADWVRLNATATGQRVSIVWDRGARALVCTIEECADLSQSLAFSPQLLNLSAWSRTTTKPEYTQVIVAGQGEGAARQVAVRTSTDGGWRRQRFIDQRNIDNLTELGAEADKLLTEGRGSTSITATLLETPGQTYGVDFRLGDLVKLTAAGQNFVEPVTSVLTQANADGSVSRTVTAGFGPLNPVTKTAANLADLSRKVSQIGAT